MKVIAAIREHPFRFAALFVLGAFAFSHGPFFLWLPLPTVFPDTFDYFNIVDILLHHPLSQLGRQSIEIPLGYPIFLLVCSAVCNKLIFIVTVQSLLELAACLYLAYVCCRYYRQYGAWVGIALGIYLMNGFTIRWNTSLSSESIYCSSLIIFAALLITAIHTNSRKWFWLLGIWMFVPPFIRPNGTYFYFLIPVLFAYLFANKKQGGLYAAIVLPVLLLNIAWATVNLKAYDRFVPGNFIRFSKILNIIQDPSSASHRPGELYVTDRLQQYLTLPSFAPFYNDLWVATYKSMYIYKQAQDTTFKMYDSTLPISPELRQMVYKEFYDTPDRFSETYIHFKELPGLQGLWLKAYHLWYIIEELLLRNILVFLIYWAITLLAAYKLLASRFKNPVYLLVTLLGGLHLASIFVVAFSHQSVQFRYTQVSEFIIYVTFALSPLLVLKNKPAQNA